jgi:tocopherol O-methyltransferase
MIEKTNYQKQIEKYYHDSQKDYEIIWGTKKHKSLHYGFWEKGIKNHHKAIENMSNKIAQFSNLKKIHRCADLGCGIGGPAFYLNKNYECKIDGISITQKQVLQANETAKNLNKENELCFYERDFCNTGLQSSNYNVVYGIESFCHADEKLEVLKESYRLLKNEGKLVVLDFFWKGNEKTNKDKIAMKNWASSWAISDFAYENDFEEILKQVGFKNIKKHIVTKNVAPSIRRLFYIFIPSYFIDLLLRSIGKRKGKHENMFSALYQYQCYKRSLWNYCIFTAEK